MIDASSAAYLAVTGLFVLGIFVAMVVETIFRGRK